MSETAAVPGSAPSPVPDRPTLFQLFTAFARISLYGFGGVLAWTHRTLVEERRWMTAEEFNELFSLAQFLPGPNIVSMSVVFGSRLHGPVGAAMTFLGLMGPPVVIVTALGVLYFHFGELQSLRAMLTGVSAAAAGLIIATAAKMATPLFRRPFAFGPVVAIIAFVTVGLLRWPLPWVLIVMAPISVAMAWRAKP